MRRIIVLTFAATTFAAVWWYRSWQHWLSHGTGSYNTPGTPHNYNYNSGFGSIIEPPLITIAGAALLYLWHSQCHVHRCYWPALRKTDAGDRACWRHHPHARLTVDLLHGRHHAAALQQAADTPAKADPVPQVLAQLRDDMHNLAETVAAAVKS